MAIDTGTKATNGRPAGMSTEEWQLRCELAACYQLTELYGMYDMPGTHIRRACPDRKTTFF